MCKDTVRKGGLEPPRPKAQEPKSCVSANFTTRAWRLPRFENSYRRRMPVSIVASPPASERQRLTGQASSLRSRRSLATWPVARTLYWATETLPSWSTTIVERIRPWYVLP